MMFLTEREDSLCKQLLKQLFASPFTEVIINTGLYGGIDESRLFARRQRIIGIRVDDGLGLYAMTRMETGSPGFIDENGLFAGRQGVIRIGVDPFTAASFKIGIGSDKGDQSDCCDDEYDGPFGKTIDKHFGLLFCRVKYEDVPDCLSGILRSTLTLYKV
ncbi:MAG TPA: hypothetical protein VJ180_15950 [Pyrinomonadaceae bacterium]|nr:hypothetical protein [Pyrinomonadaceae bacterium]